MQWRVRDQMARCGQKSCSIAAFAVVGEFASTVDGVLRLDVSFVCILEFLWIMKLFLIVLCSSLLDMLMHCAGLSILEELCSSDWWRSVPAWVGSEGSEGLGMSPLNTRHMSWNGDGECITDSRSVVICTQKRRRWGFRGCFPPWSPSWTLVTYVTMRGSGRPLTPTRGFTRLHLAAVRTYVWDCPMKSEYPNF